MKHSLVDHPQYGHCAIACEDVLAGEVIMEEVPWLLIDYDLDSRLTETARDLAYKRKRAFMTLSHPAKVSLALAQLPKAGRASLANFHLPSREQEGLKKALAYKAAVRGVSELRKRKSVFPELGQFSDDELVDFSLLASANAHSFNDHSIAFLSAGTKVTHTCLSPNVAVSTRTSKQDDAADKPTAKHVALRNIRKGELLLGTYARLHNFTTPERRRRLQEDKLFTCRCLHCAGYDLTRGSKCPACSDDKLESPSLVAPVSTMYRIADHGSVKWTCLNCKTETSDADVLSRWLIEGVSAEKKILMAIGDLEENNMSILAQFERTKDIYSLSQRIFGWRHVRTANAAVAVLETCTKALDLGAGFNHEQIEDVLESLEILPGLLEQWYEHLKADPMDDLLSMYLLLSDQLMSLSSINHDIIPRAMDLVQKLLLRVRPTIEEKRSWPIEHAMQEYYDEMLQTLDQLVNGTVEDENQGDTIP